MVVGQVTFYLSITLATLEEGWGGVWSSSARPQLVVVQLKAANLLSDLASKGHLFKILHKQTNKQNKVTENLSINKKQNKM